MSNSIKDRRSPLRAGYQGGLSQPSFKFAITVGFPVTVSLASIDDWLKFAFDMPMDHPPAVACRLQSSAEATVVGLVWRIINLGAVLLQAVRIPSFDVGQITAMRRSSSQSPARTLVISVPCTDYIQREFYSLAYQAAAEALKWLRGRALTPANLERLFRLLDEGFVNRYRNPRHF